MVRIDDWAIQERLDFLKEREKFRKETNKYLKQYRVSFPWDFEKKFLTHLEGILPADEFTYDYKECVSCVIKRFKKHDYLLPRFDSYNSLLNYFIQEVYPKSYVGLGSYTMIMKLNSDYGFLLDILVHLARYMWQNREMDIEE
jgi:hypothetical protein